MIWTGSAFKRFIIFFLIAVMPRSAGEYFVAIKELPSVIEFESSQDVGGAIVAARVKTNANAIQVVKNTSYQHRPLLKRAVETKRLASAVKVCYRSDCQSISDRFSFFATNVMDRGRQKFYIQVANLFSVHEINFNPSLAFIKKIAPLRLPAQVRSKISAQEQEIEKNKKHNAKILSQISEMDLPRKWQLPVAHSTMISGFGAMRVPPDGEPYPHTGSDFRAPIGTQVLAAAEGVVVDTSQQVLGGNVLTVDHGHGIMTRYFHLSKFLVRPGATVHAGTPIALSGETGRVEGPHLHWELRVHGKPVDPIAGHLFLERLVNRESPEPRVPASSPSTY